jgi:CheY-like chemotaxis protein
MFESEVFDWADKTILIVEDNKNNYDLLATFLKKTHANILWVTDGVEAVSTCKQNTNIDLILMDIQLTTMSGFEATRLIREFNNEVPIVAQTAYAMVGDRKKSIDAGCDDYISKPIRRKVFLSVISKFLN